MRLATLATGFCAAISLASAPFEAGAKGGRGGSHGGRSAGHHSHHAHVQHTAASGGSGYHSGYRYGYTSVFVGASFVAWPRAYYWPDYSPGPVPAVVYWYYCEPYAAYYPYVQECPAEWQPVLPTAPSPEG